MSKYISTVLLCGTYMRYFTTYSCASYLLALGIFTKMLRLSEKVKEQKDKTVSSVPKGQGISPAQMRIQKGNFS